MRMAGSARPPDLVINLPPLCALHKCLNCCRRLLALSQSVVVFVHMILARITSSKIATDSQRVNTFEMCRNRIHSFMPRFWLQHVLKELNVSPAHKKHKGFCSPSFKAAHNGKLRCPESYYSRLINHGRFMVAPYMGDGAKNRNDWKWSRDYAP